MNLTLKVWRQNGEEDKGRIVEYKMSDISPDMSFLEMMDVLNEQLIEKGDNPVAFDHDCREGICGSCSMYINGEPHGPENPLLHVSYICALLKMATPYTLNHGEPLHFLL